MHYPEYRSQGLPIGSGAMESGNKVVVEARLKGAGVHWAEKHINPMLTLRNILCSDRWDEAWPQITSILRNNETQHRKALHQKHKKDAQPEVVPEVITQSVLSPSVVEPASVSQSKALGEPEAKSSRPAPNHPWRRSPIGKARFWPADHFSKN